MSIVITVIDNILGKVYMMGDKRAITNGEIHDDFQKVFKINDNVFFGITGFAEIGMQLYYSLLSIRDSTPSQLFNFAKDYMYNNKRGNNTYTLSGIFDDEDLFAWYGRDNEYDFEDIFLKEKLGIRFIIASTGNSELFKNYFAQECQRNHNNIIEVMDRTIEYASSIDQTICNKRTLLQVVKKI